MLTSDTNARGESVDVGSMATDTANLALYFSAKTILAGSKVNVTSAAAVLVLAAGSVTFQQRTIELRAIGGDVYIADDSGVSDTNGKLIRDGEVCVIENMKTALYARAVALDVMLYYDYSARV